MSGFTRHNYVICVGFSWQPYRLGHSWRVHFVWRRALDWIRGDWSSVNLCNEHLFKQKTCHFFTHALYMCPSNSLYIVPWKMVLHHWVAAILEQITIVPCLWLCIFNLKGQKIFLRWTDGVVKCGNKERKLKDIWIFDALIELQSLLPI